MAIGKVEVQGLKEFRSALKKMDADLPKAVRIALNGATEVVTDYALTQIPRRTGAARASIKAKSTQTTARVSGGAKKAPYFPWLDFGGEGRKKGRPAARPFLKEGRYLWKALSVKRPEFLEALQAGIVAIAKDAGLELS